MLYIKNIKMSFNKYPGMFIFVIIGAAVVMCGLIELITTRRILIAVDVVAAIAAYTVAHYLGVLLVVLGLLIIIGTVSLVTYDNKTG